MSLPSTLLPVILLFLLLPATPVPAAAAASTQASPGPAAAPAWVFRGILSGDEVPAIFLALREDMTLAYDERGGSLLLAWNGRAVPESAPAAGPSPAPGAARYRAEGKVYHRRLAASPWSASGPKGTFKVTPRFEGARGAGDLAALEWSFALPGGGRVRVTEIPMFDDHYGDPGLFRNFTVSGLPKGRSLKLALAGRGFPETWGGGGEGGLEGEGDALVFVQAADGETPLKVTWSEGSAPGDPARGGAPR